MRATRVHGEEPSYPVVTGHTLPTDCTECSVTSCTAQHKGRCYSVEHVQERMLQTSLTISSLLQALGGF